MSLLCQAIYILGEHQPNIILCVHVSCSILLSESAPHPSTHTKYFVVVHTRGHFMVLLESYSERARLSGYIVDLY